MLTNCNSCVYSRNIDDDLIVCICRQSKHFRQCVKTSDETIQCDHYDYDKKPIGQNQEDHLTPGIRLAEYPFV